MYGESAGGAAALPVTDPTEAPPVLRGELVGEVVAPLSWGEGVLEVAQAFGVESKTVRGPAGSAFDRRECGGSAHPGGSTSYILKSTPTVR
jgi:hypothetical protein